MTIEPHGQPVTHESIDKTATISHPLTVEDQSSACVICCEPVTDPCETRPCLHRHFDYLCVATWLFKDSRCPVCRAQVNSLVRDSTKEALSNFGDSKPALRVDPPSQLFPATSPRFSHLSTNNPRRRPRTSSIPWGRPANPNPRAGEAALDRRQAVYANSRYSKHVGSNRVSRYRELTPQMFCEDEDLLSRARMWMRRELQVFPFLRAESTPGPRSLDGSENLSTPTPTGASSSSQGASARERASQRRRAQNAEFLLEYIIAILKSVDMMGSAGEAENMISDFLGRDNTRLFLHELRAWLRSPFTRLEDWDRAVQYEDEPRREPPGRGGGPARRWPPREGHGSTGNDRHSSGRRIHQDRFQYGNEHQRGQYWRKKKYDRNYSHQGSH